MFLVCRIRDMTWGQGVARTIARDLEFRPSTASHYDLRGGTAWWRKWFKWRMKVRASLISHSQLRQAKNWVWAGYLMMNNAGGNDFTPFNSSTQYQTQRRHIAEPNVIEMREYLLTWLIMFWNEGTWQRPHQRLCLVELVRGSSPHMA